VAKKIRRIGRKVRDRATPPITPSTISPLSHAGADARSGSTIPAEGRDGILQELLEGKADLVGQRNTKAQDPQRRGSERRAVRRWSIRRFMTLAPFGTAPQQGVSCPRPVIPAQRRRRGAKSFVGDEECPDPLPEEALQKRPFHHRRDLGVPPPINLAANPVDRVGGCTASRISPFRFRKQLDMVRPDRPGRFGRKPDSPRRRRWNPPDELPIPLVLPGDHRNDGDAGRDSSRASASIRIPRFSATSSMFTATTMRPGQKEDSVRR